MYLPERGRGQRCAPVAKGTISDIHGNLLVDEHLLVVRVVDLARPELADSVQDRAPVPDADVGEGRANGEVATKVVDGVRRRVPRETLLGEGGLVQGVVGIEDAELIVDRAVLVEELLRQEREVCGVPGVGRVHGAEDDDAERDTCRGADRQLTEGKAGASRRQLTNVLRHLRRERREKGTERPSARADVVPVEAEGEHAETLVTVRTAAGAKISIRFRSRLSPEKGWLTRRCG